MTDTSEEFIAHFFFKKDKNYILKEAQSQNSSPLCNVLFQGVVEGFNQQFNPLGIEDEITLNIRNYVLSGNEQSLLGIYENLAAIYRFQNGDAQLQIIWDGRSQKEKFTEEWTSCFSEWVNQLCMNRSFIKGILQLTVFADQSKNHFFIENYIKAIINEFFELKVLKKNGIKRVYLKAPKLAKVS